MKPLSTLMKPLDSIHFETKKKVRASTERSDVLSVPAASVVGESVAAMEIYRALTLTVDCLTLRNLKKGAQELRRRNLGRFL